VRQYFDKDVLIYQMGRVGSNTLSHSIELAGLSTAHKHAFGGDQYLFFKNKRHAWLSTLARTRARLYFKRYKGTIKIITVVRDPVARNLSLAFYMLEELLYHELKGNPNNVKGNYIPLHSIISNGIESVIHVDSAIRWFEEEFKAVTGIDVYSHDFDTGKGYGLVQQRNIQLLILQNERIDKNENIIADFLGCKTLKIQHANQANRMWYADLYASFKASYQPSKEYIDRMYTSKYMQHFYSDQALKAFQDKWRVT